MLFLAETIESAPWWVGAATGSVGLTIGASIACKVLWSELKESRAEVSEVTKQSIEVITRILERSDAEITQRDRMETRQSELHDMVSKVVGHLKDDEESKTKIMTKLDLLISHRQK